MTAIPLADAPRLAGFARRTAAIRLILALIAVGAAAAAVLVARHPDTSVLVPLAYSVRRSRFYRRFIFVPGSAVIALIALGWMIERAFDLKIF